MIGYIGQEFDSPLLHHLFITLCFSVFLCYNKIQEASMESININLKSIEDATNEFNDKLLSSNLDTYILENSKHTRNKERISLTISNISSKKEQNDLINLIHSHYLKKVIQLKKIDHYDDYFRLLLLLLGIILIIISEQLTLFLSELFLIAGWVVIWEVVYDILFTGIKRKRELKIAKKLSTCEINFINEEQ